MSRFVLGIMAVSLAGCGLLGSPGSADIEAVARQQMIASAPNAAAVEIAQRARISAKGLCNPLKDGTYACAVEVTTAKEPQTFVVVLKKDASGKWAAAK